jgi:Flp pilus assembly protein TadG
MRRIDGDHGDAMRVGANAGRDGRGQTLVEFALVFPLFVFMLFAIFDLGRAVYAYNTIGNAAREGARVAAVNQILTSPSGDCNESRPVEAVVTAHWAVATCAASSAVSLGIQTSNVTVSYARPPGNTTIGDPALDVGCVASVTVTYHFSPMTPGISSLFPTGIAMASTSRVPIERVFP